MNSIIRKTFGGLKLSYIIKQYIFSALIFFIMYSLFTAYGKEIEISVLLWLIASALLYPYSRFIYEMSVEYIFGNNVFIVSIFLLLILKIITMYICWSMAIFVAPIGLIFLFFYHSKEEKEAEKNNKE